MSSAQRLEWLLATSCDFRILWMGLGGGWWMFSRKQTWTMEENFMSYKEKLHTHTHAHTHTYIYIYNMYIWVCVREWNIWKVVKPLSFVCRFDTWMCKPPIQPCLIGTGSPGEGHTYAHCQRQGATVAAPDSPQLHEDGHAARLRAKRVGHRGPQHCRTPAASGKPDGV